MVRSRSRSRSRSGYRKKVSIKRRVVRRKSVTAPVKKYVQKAIHRQIENKTVQFVNQFTMVNYADDNTMRGFALSPGTSISISQGVGQGQRTGNKIKIMKARLVYWMVPTVYNGLLNPNPKPIFVRIFIGYSRSNPTILPPTSDLALLFQDGNIAAAPVGTIYDMLRSVNKDKFIIFRDFKHKLGYESITGTGYNAAAQYYSNTDFKYNVMRSVDITKYLIQTVSYNDTTAIPTSRGLFCWMQIVNADNSTTTGTIPCNFNYFVDITYEDA